VIHGVEVDDPYRWLEATDDPAVRAWIASQNHDTHEALDALPDRDVWHERLLALMGQPEILDLRVDTGLMFTLERSAGADQAVLAVRTSDPGGRVYELYDPTSGGDPTASIDWFEVAPERKYVAFGTSSGGSERSTLRVLEVDERRLTGLEIPDTRAASVAWEPDASGFFYTSYPPGDEYHRRVRHRHLGSGEDVLVWSDPDDPEAWPDVELSADGMWLLVHVKRGWSRVDVYLYDRHSDRWLVVVEGRESHSRFTFSPYGRLMYGVTTLGASNGRLVMTSCPEPGETDLATPDMWVTAVAESDAVLRIHRVVGAEAWVVATRAGIDTVVRYRGPDDDLGTLAQLGPVSVTAFAVDKRPTGGAYLLVSGFDSPPTLWSGLCYSADLTLQWRGDTRLRTATLAVRQVSYPARDGTDIGMFLVHRADAEPTTDTPTILNGYGGFAISEQPVWSPQIAAWCEAGGLYAVAGLRGGLEHGEEWHLAGNRGNKQNVFDDFAAAGDWLVAEGLTTRQRLAIVGRSNGGLLVGATLTQRPDLCRAVWCGVPLLDMIRYPQFLIARLWTSEYGDPDVAEEFAWLYAYSPYHHVEDGTCYPATLFTCAEGDSRVHPLHARKMAALLQERTSCRDERPVLFSEESAAGHGVGKPVSMRAAELADALAFLSWQLGWHVGPS
jgi:prolyl oligopeptidase